MFVCTELLCYKPLGISQTSGHNCIASSISLSFGNKPMNYVGYW